MSTVLFSAYISKESLDDSSKEGLVTGKNYDSSTVLYVL